MITIRLSVRNLVAIGAVLIGFWLLIRVWDVLLLAAVGLMLATALMPYMEWLRRRTGSRGVAVLLVVLSVMAVVALTLFIVAPPMVRQSRDLWDQYPELQEDAARFADERGWTGVRDRILEFHPRDLGDVIGPRLLATGRTAVSVMLGLFTLFFLAVYFMLDARRLRKFLYFSTPRDWHRHIDALLPELQRVVGGYIRGQLITSGAIFAFTFVMLTVLRVPNAVAVAAIAAVADLIPLIGVYILLAPIALTAVSVSVTKAAIAVGLMVLYQQFEDRVLVPRVYGVTLRLPTIAVVLAILIGARLLGITGALLALPVAAGIRVVVEYFAGVQGEPEEDDLDGALPPPEEMPPAGGRRAARSRG